LSQAEIAEKQPSFLPNAFAANFPLQIKGYDKEAVIEKAFIGGYPDVVLMNNPRERQDWLLDYTETLLSRDLRDIANIRRKDSLRALMTAFAAWSSKLMYLSGIGGKLKLNRQTLNTYANVLESLYLFERVPAWTETDYQRVELRDKTFAADTGLMAALLEWRLDEVLLNADRSGKFVETLVYNELAAQISLGREYRLYHYRDRNSREIDFIVRDSRGAILGIEVKAGSMVSKKEDASHLLFFKKKLAADQPFTGVILYTGENTLPLGDDIYAVPIGILWT